MPERLLAMPRGDDETREPAQVAPASPSFRDFMVHCEPTVETVRNRSVARERAMRGGVRAVVTRSEGAAVCRRPGVPNARPGDGPHRVLRARESRNHQ
jgi:hypothetical protein